MSAASAHDLLKGMRWAGPSAVCQTLGMTGGALLLLLLQEYSAERRGSVALVAPVGITNLTYFHSQFLD